eukprot:6826000-Prymnesium_polylepis.1
MLGGSPPLPPRCNGRPPLARGAPGRPAGPALGTGVPAEDWALARHWTLQAGTRKHCARQCPQIGRHWALWSADQKP